MNLLNVLIAGSALLAVNAYGNPPSAKVGESCGGIGGTRCDSGLYCDFGDATKDRPSSCGKGDAPGKCVKKPEVCTKNIKYVCGCDGKTYSNACEAHNHGITVFKDGRCDVKP